MKRKALSVLLAAVLLLGGCARRLADHPEEAKAPPDEIAVAIEKNCPQPVADALQAFCDDIYRLSGKTLRASLQYWEDVTHSQADILFLPSGRFFQLEPEMAVLRTDFLFTSYAHFDAAMNAPAILEQLNASFSQTGYSIYLTAYGGKRSLISGDGAFVDTLRSDKTEALQEVVEDIASGRFMKIEAADFSHPPKEGTLYYADTLQLSTLNEAAADSYIIINLNYLYHFYLLCLQNQMENRLSARQLAAVYEAAAVLKPACDKVWQALDTQGGRRFTSAILPSQKLQRVIREMQSSYLLSALESPIYQQIRTYST